MAGKSPECSGVGFSPVWEWCCPSCGTCLGKMASIPAPLLTLKTNGLVSESPHFLSSPEHVVCVTQLSVCLNQSLQEAGLVPPALTYKGEEGVAVSSIQLVLGFFPGAGLLDVKKTLLYPHELSQNLHLTAPYSLP